MSILTKQQVIKMIVENIVVDEHDMIIMITLER